MLSLGIGEGGGAGETPLAGSQPLSKKAAFLYVFATRMVGFYLLAMATTVHSMQRSPTLRQVRSAGFQCLILALYFGACHMGWQEELERGGAANKPTMMVSAAALAICGFCCYTCDDAKNDHSGADVHYSFNNMRVLSTLVFIICTFFRAATVDVFFGFNSEAKPLPGSHEHDIATVFVTLMGLFSLVFTAQIGDMGESANKQNATAMRYVMLGWSGVFVYLSFCDLDALEELNIPPVLTMVSAFVCLMQAQLFHDVAKQAHPLHPI